MADITSAEQLTDEVVSTLDPRQLIDSVILTFDMDEIERVRTQALMKLRAKELKLSGELAQVIRAFSKADKLNAEQYTRAHAQSQDAIPLAFDGNGRPCNTIDNILLIMRNDERYANIRYNQLLNAPEIINGASIRRWTDTDEAESKRYIEKQYNIHNEAKHYDALRILFREREYHPIRNLLKDIEWDGEERISNFLSTWMMAEPSEYTSEVSRLIFAGGINRLYNPGCKFDDVPVLIGTSQGEGKSTIVRWLAMEDEFYSEVTDIEGQRGIEQLEGAWICEIAELLALTKAKEQEAVKSYITRQKDKYRRPYDRQTTEYPRRCIFIGTTNNEQFLKDKTGNRRFYPVKVHSSGYWLFDHEEECRNYIRQCWAEAKVKYSQNQMPNFANKALREEFQAAQNAAMEDDWRVGVIEEYISEKPVGSYVCVRQIMVEALSPNPDFPSNYTKKDSNEVATILDKLNYLEKCKNAVRISRRYGQQKCWIKTRDPNEKEGEDLPFET